ncbi:MAG: TolC family protein [Hyphomicrobiales bacterium]
MKAFTVTATSLFALLAGCAIQPNALSEVEIVNLAEKNRANVTANQEPVKQSIDLYEAMARALKYNLDHRVEVLNAALAIDNLKVARFDLLPRAVVNSGYTGRNNFSGGISQSLLTGQQSLEPSTSSDRQVGNADIALSWNVLDFGLSYIRAKQGANEALIAEERRRRVIQEVVRDVRAAYWRAVSAERLGGRLAGLQGRVSRALNNSRKLENSGATSPVTALTYQRELLDIKRQIEDLHQELKVAKAELARLMNLRPNDHFHLVVPKRTSRHIKLNVSYNDMVSVALENRPELRELAYRGRINKLEAKAGLVELLPGIEVFTGANFDSNDLLFNNNFLQAGARTSWNLLQVFSLPAKSRANKTQGKIIETQALAMTMAIMAQINIGRVRFHSLHRKYHTAGEYLNVQRKILRQVQVAASRDAASEQSLIREEMNTLVASVRYDIVNADMQNIYGEVFAAMGVDTQGANLTGNESVSQLKQLLRDDWLANGLKPAPKIN